MKKHSIIRALQLLLIIGYSSLLFVGCSYTKFENEIRDKIDSEYSPEPATDILDPVNQADIIYFHVGQMIPGYYSFTDEAGNFIETGAKGINYHIDSVNIVESPSSNDIILDAPLAEGFDFFGDMTNNSLIVVELTATLEPNSQPPDTLGMDFFADFGWGEGYAEFRQDFPYNCNPVIVYFSDHVVDGDVNPLTGEIMKQSTDYYTFHTSIDEQHPLKFKIGIVASNDLIDDRNVFLGEFYAEPPSDNPIYKIDLLGRY